MKGVSVLMLSLLAGAAEAAYVGSANELTDGTACRDVSVVWAKGTNENGNLGEADNIGPVWINALAALLPSGSMAVEGTDGDFTIATFLDGGDPKAIADMTDVVLKTAERCTNTKIVMAGYSQGAQVVHAAANSDLFMVNPLLVNHVVAYLTFGDPDSDYSYTLVNNPKKVKVVCHDDDVICDGGLVPNDSHHAYGPDAPAAATWTVERINAGFAG